MVGVRGIERIAFGPVPSRRLGSSLGVNNIPPKHCSYACVYCQAGRTGPMEIQCWAFYPVLSVVDAVRDKVDACRSSGQTISYITFVPDGEPTLDCGLGLEIRALKPLGIPIAVITNGSLLWRPEVRADLAAADVVSVKVDAAREDAWRRVNRPHGALRLETVQQGIRDFAAGYQGRLLTETMLVRGINDDAGEITAIAEFLAQLAPRTAYLAVPTRPPAEADVLPPAEKAVVHAYQILRARLKSVELLVSVEEGSFGSTGDLAEDLLAILAVHPMREEAVRRYLAEAGASWEAFEELIRAGRVASTDYEGSVFYVRRWTNAA